MKLYGSLTSPFVRRVRIVAQELGEPLELVDAFSDEGQARLRALSPVWKVPTVEIDGRVLWDSSIILDYLIETRGRGPLRLPEGAARWDELAFRAAVDEALLSLIRLFYLKRDGADVEKPAYLQKERQRTASILAFASSRLRGAFCTDEDGFGLAEVGLLTALEWMQLRSMWDVAADPKLVAFLEAHRGRPSVASTAPPRP